MAAIEHQVERRSAAERWSYGVIAVVSVLTAPLTAITFLFVGIVVGVVGAGWGAASRSEHGQRRGVRVLLTGLALLVGPVLYLLLAVAVRLS